MEFRLQDYEVLFYVFPDTENALVAIVPAFANKGLLEVELENARREILKVQSRSMVLQKKTMKCWWMRKDYSITKKKRDAQTNMMSVVVDLTTFEKT